MENVLVKFLRGTTQYLVNFIGAIIALMPLFIAMQIAY